MREDRKMRRRGDEGEDDFIERWEEEGGTKGKKTKSLGVETKVIGGALQRERVSKKNGKRSWTKRSDEWILLFIYVGTFKILLLVIDMRFLLNFKAGFKVINFLDFVLSDMVMNLDK